MYVAVHWRKTIIRIISIIGLLISNRDIRRVSLNDKL